MRPLAVGGAGAWGVGLQKFRDGFPNVFTLGIVGLGPMTSKGSGLIMSACVGGAVIPYLIGALADKVGIQHSFILPVICYLYIAYYGLWGSKPTRTVTA